MNNGSRRLLKDRFMEKVYKEENGCWNWTGCIDKATGYGMINPGGRSPAKRAHRASYEIFNDQIPEGMCVLHKCDNRRCVNPEHLFLGTKKDNSQDMSKKGRGRGGGTLKESQVHAIRADLAAGMKQKEIANKYGISDSHVQRIKKREIWAWLKEADNNAET